MNQQPLSNHSEGAALRRFSFITRIEDALKEGNTLGEALRRAALSSEAPLSARTLEDWWYAYRKNGFAALGSKPRSDRGQSRKCSEEQARFLLQQVQASPKTPLSVLYRLWKKQDPQLPSLSTVYRVLEEHQMGSKARRKAAVIGSSGPTKSFEAPFPNDLWMVDFSNGPFLKPADGGKVHPTHLCLILDDHSRLVAYARYYENADTQAFHHTLKEAIRRRGIPCKLYTDQGGPFTCDHTRIICANLQIRLLHAKPYHAWSKGKVERMFRTIQDDFEAVLRMPGQGVSSLEELNARLTLWLQETYHVRVHSSTGMAPEARFQQPHANLRGLSPEQDLDQLFYMRLKRVVRKDGTIRLDNRSYEVNLSLRGLEVQVRYDPFVRQRIEIYHRGQFMGLASLVNLHLNSQLSQSHHYEK